MSLDYSLRLKHFILIGLGAAIYAFGFVYFYMANYKGSQWDCRFELGFSTTFLASIQPIRAT